MVNSNTMMMMMMIWCESRTSASHSYAACEDSERGDVSSSLVGLFLWVLYDILIACLSSHTNREWNFNVCHRKSSVRNMAGKGVDIIYG